MNKSESIGALAAALSAVQAELKIAKKDKINPFFKSKYADLQTVWEVARPLLAKHGLAVLQLPGGDGTHVVLTTMLVHSSGEWIADDGLAMTPAKTDPQGIASCVTYARRYGFQAVIGVVADEDDDGEAASRKPTPAPTKVVANDSGKPTSDVETRLLADCTKGWADWDSKRKWAEDNRAAKGALPADAQARIAAAFLKAAPRAKGLGKKITEKVINGGPTEEELAEARAREAEEARAQ